MGCFQTVKACTQYHTIHSKGSQDLCLDCRYVARLQVAFVCSQADRPGLSLTCAWCSSPSVWYGSARFGTSVMTPISSVMASEYLCEKSKELRFRSKMEELAGPECA